MKDHTAMKMKIIYSFVTLLIFVLFFLFLFEIAAYHIMVTKWYNFYLRVKNLNPEESNVDFTLLVKTGDNEWKSVGDRKTVKIGPEPSMVYFNKTKPFVVNDLER